MTVTVRTLTGPDLDAHLDGVAALRIAVFRDWPYLYEGSMEYEARYLAHYRNSPAAVLVGAFDGDTLIGAATGTPMEDHADDFAAPLAQVGLPVTSIFYCAESVLLPGWRGRGLGHRFFDLREAHARALGRSHVAFSSVIRPDDHPLRPPQARTNDAFWRKRGYAPVPGALARFRWTDLGESAESEKPLQVWLRALC